MHAGACTCAVYACRVLAEVGWVHDHRIIQDISVVDPVFNSGPDYLRVLAALQVKPTWASPTMHMDSMNMIIHMPAAAWTWQGSSKESRLWI